MKSEKTELQLAAELVAQTLDAASEDAVDLGVSTEAYAVAILHYVRQRTGDGVRHDALMTSPQMLRSSLASMTAGSIIH